MMMQVRYEAGGRSANRTHSQFDAATRLTGTVENHSGLKSYYEFDARDRPEGWNTWLPFAISPAAQAGSMSSRLVTK